MEDQMKECPGVLPSQELMDCSDDASQEAQCSQVPGESDETPCSAQGGAGNLAPQPARNSGEDGTAVSADPPLARGNVTRVVAPESPMTPTLKEVWPEASSSGSSATSSNTSKVKRVSFNLEDGMKERTLETRHKLRRLKRKSEPVKMSPEKKLSLQRYRTAKVLLKEELSKKAAKCSRACAIEKVDKENFYLKPEESDHGNDDDDTDIIDSDEEKEKGSGGFKFGSTAHAHRVEENMSAGASGGSDFQGAIDKAKTGAEEMDSPPLTQEERPLDPPGEFCCLPPFLFYNSPSEE